MCRKLIKIIGILAVLLIGTAVRADLQLVENFTTMATGSPDGRACTGVAGGTWDTQSEGSGNVVIEDISADRCVRVSQNSAGPARGAAFNGVTNPIEDTETGVLFFRFMIQITSNVTSVYMGMHSVTGTDPMTGTTCTAAYVAAGFGVVDNGAPSGTAINIIKTDGSGAVLRGATQGVWYDAWIVANNAGDTYDLYMREDTEGRSVPMPMPTSADLIGSNLAFGRPTTSALVGGMLACPTLTVAGARAYMDDIYWDGTQGLATTKTTASAPSPANNKTDVPRDVVLGWEPGIYAQTHDVYFGTDTTAVQNANTNDASGIYRGRKPKDPTSYDPPETLNFSKIHYWRVDEVNGSPDYTIYPGSVWSFTAEPFAYPITPIAATASSSSDANMVPGKTIDGSGLNSSDQHSIVTTDMWLSSATGPQPTWIQYEFDKAYKLYQMWVWNYNGQSILTRFGIRNVTIQYSTNGTDYTTLGTTHEFTQAAGLATYVHTTEIAFGGVAAKYVRITANSNWGGVGYDQYGLSEVRFFHIPVYAREPKPASGTGLGLDDVVLSWRSGREAASHEIYFSTNRLSVINGTALVGTVTENSYKLGHLALGETYYWKINEVNEAATPRSWAGDPWEFSTIECLTVDDFEDYNDSDPHKIWQTWIDGLGYDAPPPGKPGNNTGSIVGYGKPPFAEQTAAFVHGGRQSMPLDYDNTKAPPWFNYSEADRTFAASQDWTIEGIKALSLWFRGWPASVGSFVESPPGIYTITASGTDIWNNATPRETWFHDEFHYAYQQANGIPVTLIAKVESVSNTNVWAKAGVMIRGSLDANSTHAAMYITPASGASFQYRSATGGPSDSNTVAGVTAPQYVKLVFDNYGFSGYYSPDGLTWTQVRPAATATRTPPTISPPFYVGLALTAHDAALTCTAKFSSVSVTGGSGIWGHRDIGIRSNTVAPLYVTLQDSTPKTATVTHPDPNAVLRNTWQQWNIDLKAFTGVNPKAIKRITIGVGNRSAPQPIGIGTLYVDDIRLYPPRCYPTLVKPVGDFSNNCLVDYPDLAILTDNWLINEYQVTPIAPSDANLEAYYRFENSLIDSSGKNRNCDPCGGIPTYAVGKVGQALDVNGINDYAEADVTASTLGIGGNRARTITAWVYTRAFNSQGGIFDMGAYTNSQNFSLRTMTRGENNHSATQDWWRAQRYGYPTYDFDFEYPSLNKWVYMALVYDGNTAGNESRAYADGILVGRQTALLNTADTVPFRIGRWQNAYFNGLIDELRVYSRALSQDEVAYLAGRTASFTQPLYRLLTPQDPAINMYNDGAIDLKDYTVLADMWLEELLWPQ